MRSLRRERLVVLSFALECYAEVFDAIVPLRCVACGVHGEQICGPCRDGLTAGRLAYRMPSAGAPAVFALGAYSGSLRAAVHALKFRNRRDAARSLGQILGARLLVDADVIVPVPLHPRRLLARGYNQAEAIAQGVAISLGVACVGDALVRVRETLAQSSLSLRERQKNVVDAFEPRPPAEALHEARVLLVDDVVTTGSTSFACADAIRSAGAVSVTVAALAIRV
jgi:ComF family protein